MHLCLSPLGSDCDVALTLTDVTSDITPSHSLGYSVAKLINVVSFHGSGTEDQSIQINRYHISNYKTRCRLLKLLCNLPSVMKHEFQSC